MTPATTETPAGFGLKNSRTGQGCRLALQELWLTGRILPAGARLVVRHTFQSAEDRPLEMIYAFALPRDAALRRFRVAGQGFSVRSELKPVADAQRQYEEGIDRGNLSTLARMYRDGLVNLNVGNIAPGETVTVWLELAAGVESRDDGFRFRFPFTLAPAYHREARAVENEDGQGELELPEEEFGDLILPSWARGAGGLHRVGFSLAVHAPGGLREVSSPSHPLRVCLGESGRARALLGSGPDLPNRDLVLDVRTPAARTGILAGLDEEGHARAAVIIPSTEFGSRPASGRRIVFLLDRSGSMEGPPIEQARRALAACLSVLEPADRFAVAAFDNQVEVFQPMLADGNGPVREQAKQFLARIDARGGTELLAGIQEAVRLLGGQGGEIMVLTDGQVAGTEPILQAARKSAIRLHCLGIGSASQDRFLALLARETGGVSRFVTPRERVDLAALEMFAALGRPVADKLRLSIEGLPGGRIEPQPPEAVYSGTPLTLFIRADRAGQGRLVAQWETEGAARRSEYGISAGPDKIGETIKLLQGARLITEAETRGEEAVPSRGGLFNRQKQRAERRLEQLSLEYGLASQAMSLVAVLERPSDQPGRLPETRVVAVGMPEDTAFESYFGQAAQSPQSQSQSQPGALFSSFRRAASPAFRPAPSRMNFEREDHPPNYEECMPSNLLPDDYDVPSFQLRRRSRFFEGEPPPPPPQYNPEDLLVEVAARLEADGGLPGRDIQARAIATLVALLCFLEQGHTAGQGPFRQHLERMAEFLSRVTIPAWGEDFESVRDLVLDAAHAGGRPGKDWHKLARGLVIEHALSPGTAWEETRQRLH